MSKSKSSTKSLKSELNELERQLAFARYKQGDYFPHPHWKEDETRLVAEIAKLKSKIINQVLDENEETLRRLND